MSKTRDALVAVAMVVIITGGYMYSTRPSTSRAGILRDLYASPVCLDAHGAPRAGAPTVAQAWTRTTGTAIGQAHADFIGMSTIELYLGPTSSKRYLTFIQTGPHRWRFNEDANTSTWVAGVCGSG
jgi:hypothetical protein